MTNTHLAIPANKELYSSIEDPQDDVAYFELSESKEALTVGNESLYKTVLTKEEAIQLIADLQALVNQMINKGEE